MPETKGNLELKLKLFYKDNFIDGQSFHNRMGKKTNKPFVIGRHKKVFWQILDPKFPKKFNFIKSQDQKYKINLPPNAKIEELQKNNVSLDKTQIERLIKNRSFVIDDRFSGTIILNSDYKIKFLFIKKPVIKAQIPPEYKTILKRHLSKEDKRAVSIFTFSMLLGIVVSIIIASITLPERVTENVKAIEYAARIIMPAITEEEFTPMETVGFGEATTGGEAEGEGEGGEATEAQVATQVVDRQAAVSRRATRFKTQLFASIGGIGTTGGVATRYALTGGAVEGEEGTSTGGDLASQLASGTVMTKTVAGGEGVKLSVAGGGGGNIDAKLVQAGEAARLIKTGGLKRSTISSIKGSARAKFQTGRKSADFMKVFDSYTPGLNYIHSEMLKKYPNLHNVKIMVRILVDERGIVKSVTIDRANSISSNTEFENRILQAIRSWKFPKIKAGMGEVEYKYPLMFG